jgi:hemerythrin-like domain-containing protein
MPNRAHSSTEPDSKGLDGLRTLLSQDHAALDATFEALLEACRANARADAIKNWKTFEQGLTLHMNFEEAHLFPALKQFNPAEYGRLSQEHELFRKRLAEMSIEVDLNLLHLSRVDPFVAQLRQHAKQENALLYEWADNSMPATERSSALQRAKELLSFRSPR